MQFRNLLAWQSAIDLAVAIYNATQSFPKDEHYGLRSQMRRAAVSISANIAEGKGRNNPKEYVQFLGIACGSFAELESYIELAKRLGYMEVDDQLDQLMSTTGKLVYRLRMSLATASGKNLGQSNTNPEPLAS